MKTIRIVTGDDGTLCLASYLEDSTNKLPPWETTEYAWIQPHQRKNFKRLGNNMTCTLFILLLSARVRSGNLWFTIEKKLCQ